MTPPRRGPRTDRVLAPGWFGYLLIGGTSVGAVVVSLVQDVSAPLAAVALVLAALVGLGLGLLRPRLGMPLSLVAFMASMGVTGVLDLDGGVALVPPAALLLGFTLPCADTTARRHQTTTLDPTLGAVTAFLTDGSADLALPWSDDDPDGEMRPPALQVTDRDR